jgi:hypothetical protein
VLIVVAKDCVVGGQDGTTTVAKNGVHALVCQYLNDHIGAAHHGACQGVFLLPICGLWRGHAVFQKVT